MNDDEAMAMRCRIDWLEKEAALQFVFAGEWRQKYQETAKALEAERHIVDTLIAERDELRRKLTGEHYWDKPKTP
jgi:hypothetical protein